MKTALQLNLFLRSFFLQAGWNYQKFQNLGLAFIMLPVLKSIYHNQPEKLNEVLKRYLDTFNTHPVMASFCIGSLSRQEEKMVSAQTPPEIHNALLEWDGMKRALSITAASIGDRLFWGTLKPLTLLLALFIWLALNVNFLEIELEPVLHPSYVWIGAIAAWVLFNSIALFVRWKGLQIAYTAKENACFGLIAFDWNKTIYYAKRMGIFLAIGLLLFAAYRFVQNFSTALDFHFVARLLIISIFVLLSFTTRRLRVPNMYLYITVVAVFNLVGCL